MLKKEQWKEILPRLRLLQWHEIFFARVISKSSPPTLVFALFVNVPPGGLSLLTNQTANQSYRENQFRFAGTVLTSWHGFTLSDRNMYVCRFTPASEVNRYLNKIYIGHPLSLGYYKVNPFVFEEVYHDFLPAPWLRRNWVVAAVDMPINRNLTFQPSYIRQDDQYLRSVNFLGLALIIRTGPLFESRHDHKNAPANAELSSQGHRGSRRNYALERNGAHIAYVDCPAVE